MRRAGRVFGITFGQKHPSATPPGPVLFASAPATARPAVSAVGPQLSPLSHSFRQAPGFCRHASTSAGPAASAVEPQLPPNPKLSPAPPVSDKNRAVSSGRAVFRAKCRSEGTKEKAILQLFFVRGAGRSGPRSVRRPVRYPLPFTFYFSPSQNSRTQRR